MFFFIVIYIRREKTETEKYRGTIRGRGQRGEVNREHPCLRSHDSPDLRQSADCATAHAW